MNPGQVYLIVGCVALIGGAVGSQATELIVFSYILKAGFFFCGSALGWWCRGEDDLYFKKEIEHE